MENGTVVDLCIQGEQIKVKYVYRGYDIGTKDHTIEWRIESCDDSFLLTEEAEEEIYQTLIKLSVVNTWGSRWSDQ